MPRLAASLLSLALATAAIALASCGEEDAQLLPGGTAREITTNLDTVRLLADEGDCVGAESAALQVSEQVEAIEGVDERLKRALREWAARLNEVVAECEEEVETVPDVATPETEPEPLDDADEEKEEEKKKEKEEDDEESEEEEQGAKGEAEEVEETEPALPPQAEGEGKGLGNGNGQGGESGGSPSGGVAPANPAGEGG
jgi:outer membrane biosynthesis protein TonB